ncbi:Holliday junction resolvase RuvX [Thermasporomyces composti]|jgi:putative Holliday junction resolvase|uniref:Putative pre-16S rRNA nuclease n=1 Tax=Thermasporomyces composti TaxID=696763 RepID=A0A3D9V912_THECX|nr:Holliday junction resolvase RuvX [Thermasporomyces composti]REF38252.1 putative Holliday junction resolvase [Thermasporomyces composti]
MRGGVRLAVDVGEVRIGVARSDPSGTLAVPLETIRRGPGDLDRIAALAAESEAVEVVVGLPVSLSGKEGPAASKVRAFASDLARRLSPLPVRLVDERLSTVGAHQAFRARGLSTRQTRGRVDQAAAAIILQSALDAERSTGAPPGAVVSAPEAGERKRTGNGKDRQ